MDLPAEADDDGETTLVGLAREWLREGAQVERCLALIGVTECAHVDVEAEQAAILRREEAREERAVEAIRCYPGDVTIDGELVEYLRAAGAFAGYREDLERFIVLELIKRARARCN
jgi:hypothetical protein